MSEPADRAAPQDPDGPAPRPLLGVTFWIMMAFTAVCVLAGAAVAVLGPRASG
jgi:hypothetical protein